jgi:peptidoglycan-N-acetylglucosamine deacetylase
VALSRRCNLRVVRSAELQLEKGVVWENMLALKTHLKSALGTTRVHGVRSNRILLTFDDGPHPTVTPRVLNLLAKFNASAIFFIVGACVERAPQLLKEVLASGHLLGNHSYSHQPDLGIRAYVRDLKKAQALIEETAGTLPTFFRPPEGRLTLASIFSPRLLGLSTMLWSLDSNDWRLRSIEEVHHCANRVLDHFRCNGLNRDIILFHDDNEFTPSVLEPVLVELTATGADLRTM